MNQYSSSNQSIKSSLHSLYYSAACNEWQGPRLSAEGKAGKTAPKKSHNNGELVGDIVSDLTGPGIEPKTQRAHKDIFDHNRPLGIFL